MPAQLTMWPEPYARQRGSLLGRAVSFVLVTMLGLLALQALLIALQPWLPWLGLGLIGYVALSVWSRRRSGW